MDKDDQNMAVGILGLGIIGSRVAEHVRKAGHEVFVWSRTPQPVPNFMAEAAEVARLAKVIQIFVRDGEALLEVMAQMRADLSGEHLVMNHATVHPEATRAAAAICEGVGAGFLDAPFTGSKMAAQRGKLVYYVGGDDRWIELATPILRCSGENVLRMGGLGDASVVKIATNLVTAVVVKSLCEAAAIAMANGVPLRSLLTAFEANANFSPVIGMKLSAIIDGDFDPHFSLKNMLKDAEFAVSLAQVAGVDAGTLEATVAAMRMGVAAGDGEKDFSVLGKELKEVEA